MTGNAKVTISGKQRALVGRRRYRFACTRLQQLRGYRISEVCPKTSDFMTLQGQKNVIRHTVKARNTTLKSHQEAAQEYKTP